MIKKCTSCSFIINIREEAYNLLGTICPKCGEELGNIKFPLMKDMDIPARVKFSVGKWFGELGIEGTIEMLESRSNLPNEEYFHAELLNRGFSLRTKGHKRQDLGVEDL